MSIKLVEHSVSRRYSSKTRNSYSDAYFPLNSHIFHSFEAGIALAIAASIEWKRETNSSAAQLLSRCYDVPLYATVRYQIKQVGRWWKMATLIVAGLSLVVWWMRNRYLSKPHGSDTGSCSAAQRQTAVTAYFSSEQLQLFALALQYRDLSARIVPAVCCTALFSWIQNIGGY